MNEPIVRVRMARVEASQLAQLVDDFRELVGSDRDADDPALQRLAPDPYPDDADASIAFRGATRDELFDRRALDADVVRASLSDLRADIATMSQTEAFTEHELAVDAADVDAWLRTLTALRLVVAERLSISDEDDHDPDDPRFGVYDWLGYRLEIMIEAAESHL